MKKKLYDNYDYEEAYQKQIANLEEWELERLMKDGKVECLYRTTTTKSEKGEEKDHGSKRIFLQCYRPKR